MGLGGGDSTAADNAEAENARLKKERKDRADELQKRELGTVKSASANPFGTSLFGSVSKTSTIG